MDSNALISNTLGFVVSLDDLASTYFSNYALAIQAAIDDLIERGSGGVVYLSASFVPTTDYRIVSTIELRSNVHLDGQSSSLEVNHELLLAPVFSAENVHDCSVRNLNIIIDVSSKEIRHAPVFALTSRASASEEDASEPAEVAYCRH